MSPNKYKNSIKIKTFLILCCAFAVFGCASFFGGNPVRAAISDEDKAKQIKKIAVLPFDIVCNYRPGPDFVYDENEKYIVSDLYIAEFIFNGYQCIERGQVEKVLSEQSFRLTGATDGLDLVEIGKILNVQGLVIGNVNYSGNYLYAVKLADAGRADIIWMPQVRILRRNRFWRRLSVR